MIVKAFLRWSETAKAADRAKAANALGRAFLEPGMNKEQHRAAYMALTYLLDDPSPSVRLSLAEALAEDHNAPRAIIVSLAEDQPEIACTVIARSPVLCDADLVDLAGRGSGLTRALIAARPRLTRGACAAICEIGDVGEVIILLENVFADISRFSLKRIAERFGCDCLVRDMLLERDDLPADARHLLVYHTSAALSSSALVCGAMARSRIDHIIRDAEDAAVVAIAGNVADAEIPSLVEHLRDSGQLTPSFLIHALCAGKLDFFAGAIVNLSGLDERRVRSILATGRIYALRALFHATGLSTDISAVFVEATMLWRSAAASLSGFSFDDVCNALLKKFRATADATASQSELLDLIEKLHISEQRQKARSYAYDAAIYAA